jgi:phenylacetate-CoA ligase
MPDWLKLYHRLPYPFKVVAASARGRRLKRWRYGPETEDLVAGFLAHDGWSKEQWRRWQEERLAFVLHHAATQVPFYRDQWGRRRRAGDRAAWDKLENWPLLTKESLRREPRSFLAIGCDHGSMFYEHTSGTTACRCTSGLAKKQ